MTTRIRTAVAGISMLAIGFMTGPIPIGIEPAAAQDTENEDYSHFSTKRRTARFLTQATFGPRWSEVNALQGTSASEWFVNQTKMPTNYALDIIEEYRENYESEPGEVNDLTAGARDFAFWRNAIQGQDQLRQRMAFALSQIIVVSDAPEAVETFPQAVGYVQDIFARHAFGNYRDILEEVTYSPMMGFYLTYLGNERANPETGSMPDENYARELMQLFTIGLVALDGKAEPKLDLDGNPIELYTNADITGLARVFTGLDFAEEQDTDDIEGVEPDVWALPMRIYPERHSPEAKNFLGITIPAGTGARESITRTLDRLMAHRNIGPFIGRQLIQRFTASNPPPSYVQRVARAFNQGTYTLPDGTQVGTMVKGDLTATIAAVLFDPTNRLGWSWRRSDYGKVREPVLRLTNWARMFNANAQYPEYDPELGGLGETSGLSQHPYRARSVFNFYRPGFVPPATIAGARGVTVPEMQIVNATSIPGYINTIGEFIFREGIEEEFLEELQEAFDESDVDIDEAKANTTMVPDYSPLMAFAIDSEQLVSQLNSMLVYGTLSKATQETIIQTIDSEVFEEIEDEEVLLEKIKHAVWLVMTSPDYLIQR